MRRATAGLAIGTGLGLSMVGAAGAGVALELVAEGFTSPLGFVQDPSDPTVQYVVEQGGLVRVMKSGVLMPDPFVSLSSVLGDLSGETGLLGLAFPQDYLSTGAFYASYTDSNDDNVIARLTRSPGDPLRGDIESLTPLIGAVQPLANHTGGNIEFGPDGMLYVALGDGYADSQTAQDRSNLLGSILRIDVSNLGVAGYSIPSDNPFVGMPGVREEIWSYGLRNPWRFSFDMGACASGAMLIADVGQFALEEINYEPMGVAGRNYGWPCREGTLPFEGCNPPTGESFTEPIHEYAMTGSQSITGGYVYRGARMSNWKGRYFYADFVKGVIWSLDTTGGVASDNVQHLDTDIFISSFGRDAAGELYITDYYGGKVWRLTQTEPSEDLNNDMIIDGADLGLLLSAWGAAACGVADLTNDGQVDGADLGLLLGAWGN